MSKQETRPPDQNELRNAMLVILGGLPLGAEISFFWKDDVQNMQVSLQGCEPITYCLNRAKDGSGVVSCNVH